MFPLASGTSPWSGSTPPGQPTSSVQTAVDNMSGPVETDPTGDADEGLNQLDDEDQNKSEVYKPQNDQDGIRHPLTSAGTD